MKLAEVAPKLLNPTLMRIFGRKGIDLPSGLRDRYQKEVEQLLNGNPPLINQIGIAWKASDMAKVEVLLGECISLANGEIDDERFFDIFWQMGQCKLQQNDKTSAIRNFREAISRFPHLARAAQYQKLVDLLFEHNDTLNDADAEAIVHTGWEALNGERNPDAMSEKAQLLQKLHASIQLRGRHAVRPLPLRERILMQSSIKNRRHTRNWKNRGQ